MQIILKANELFRQMNKQVYGQVFKSVSTIGWHKAKSLGAIVTDSNKIDVVKYLAWSRKKLCEKRNIIKHQFGDASEKNNKSPQTPILKASELFRKMNQQGYGQVMKSLSTIGWHKSSSLGYFVTSNNKIDVAKYITWSREKLYGKQNHLGRNYQDILDRENERYKEKSAAGRDIGEIPPVENPERKAACSRNFRLFCDTYCKENFTMPWCKDHLKIISRIETAVLDGGLFALAMPRGSGKSTLVETAVIWAMLYGHRKFILLVGASELAAIETLDDIKSEFDINELIEKDFPEVCVPIHALSGSTTRCNGQLYHGKRTRISWRVNEIILPTIGNSVTSGIVVRVAGITGRIRGMKYKRGDGKNVRPDLVVIDDPQTAESAWSLEQTKKRIKILSADILGLAGPGKKISGIMPCTIIRPGDLADTILDRKLHPDWCGEKTRMVYSMPKNMKLWQEYAQIRANALETVNNFQAATNFYIAHREEMDEGAVVQWEARKNYDEISALQHAMNLKFADEEAFRSEYQNDPMPPDAYNTSMLKKEQISAKTNGLPAGVVPLKCQHVTAFIDIQKSLLYYCVIAWADDFTGSVIDYGAWPGQRVRTFTLAKASPTIQDKFPHAGLEGALYGALTELFSELLKKEWIREDGAPFKIERALIDANWGASTDIVYQFCREHNQGNILYPAHGHFVGAASQPMTEYRKLPGEKIGYNWYIPNLSGKRAYRHVVFDCNYWKSFLHQRLAVPTGDKGSLTLFGNNPKLHETFSEHLTAEYSVKTQGRGREVEEWKMKPTHIDNHWFDCAVGCCVAASMLNCALAEIPEMKKKTKPLGNLYQ